MLIENCRTKPSVWSPGGFLPAAMITPVNTAGGMVLSMSLLWHLYRHESQALMKEIIERLLRVILRLGIIMSELLLPIFFELQRRQPCQKHANG